MMTLSEQLHEMLYRVSCDVFAAYGAQPHPVTEPEVQAELQYSCVLGITGAELGGSILVVVEPSVLSATNPTPAVSDAKWLAELTNQLVGRFKNELVRRGVDVALAIPVVLSATKLVPLVDGAMEPVVLRVGAGQIAIWLEYEGEPVLAVSDQHLVPCEGEALMF